MIAINGEKETLSPKDESIFKKDSEAYSKTIEKMMNSEDVSPIMKKVLEKEMHRAKKGEHSGAPSKKSSESLSKEEEEVNQWLSSEEMIVKQATEAINSLERSLESTSCPEFMKPFARSLIKRMKKLKGEAQSNIREVEEEMGVKSEESVGVKSEESVTSKGEECMGVKSGENVTSKGEAAGVKSGENVEAKSGNNGASKSHENETTNENTSKADSASEKSSDFMKNLKPSSGQKNEFFTYIGMSIVCAFLYALVNRNGETASITYDEFVKDLLLTRHAKNITVKYSGVVLVEIEDGSF